MNVLTKVKSVGSDVRDCIIRKAAPITIAVVAASNATIVSFAESEVDISAVTDTITSSLSDLVSKAALACAAVVGVGLTIFGIKWVVKTIKGFFSKIAG